MGEGGALGYSAFDEQKVKNIPIEYRLQSIFLSPACELCC